MKKIIYLSMIVLIFSCRKIEKIEMAGNITPKLVVNCVAVSGEEFLINVHRSLSVLDNASIKPVKTAIVKIYSAGILLETVPYSPFDEAYLSTIVANKNSNYKIEVSAKGYESVSSETVIVDEVILKNISINIKGKSVDSFGPNSIYGNFKTGKIRVEFSDPGDKRNFYMLQLNDVTTGSSSGNFYTSTYWECNAPGVEAVLNSGFSSYNSGAQFYFNDDLNNGKNISLEFTTASEYNTYRVGNDSIIAYELVLYNLSEDYSRHLYTISLSRQNEDDPFEEPVQIFSNVKGGYGVFGSLNQSGQYIAFPK